jgi:predicted aspartyl protease
MDRTRRQATAALLASAAAALTPSRVHAKEQAPPKELPPDPSNRIGGGHDAFDHLIVPVTINGEGPFAFLVDTGANITCVSRGLAARLELPIRPSMPMHTIVGVRSLPIALIAELRVGERSQRSLPVLAVPLDDPRLDGVLGVDWLKDQRLTLDFTKNSLEVASSHDDWRTPGRVIVPARRRLGQLTIIDADLNGRRISAMIDSGSEASLCNTALVGQMGGGERAGKRQTIAMVTVFGEPFEGDLIHLPFLRLGGLQLGDVPVVHADTHAFDIWGLSATPAVLLGMDLLRQFRAVALDFGRGQVRFDLAA